MNNENNNARQEKKTRWITLALTLVIVVGIGVIIFILLQPQSCSANNVEDSQGEATRTEETVNHEESKDINDVSSSTRHDSGKEGNSTANNSNKKEKKSNQHKRLKELPATNKGEKIIYHTGFTLSYNSEHNTPNWVAWELTEEETNGTGRRAQDFLPDPDLSYRNQVTTRDYSGSGYDRGHMCPAADNKWNAHAMTECFYMSNMCPQLHELNSGSWEKLETACRRWAKKEGSIYIVCGPVYKKDRKHETIGRNLAITVPDGFFKCVLSLREGNEKAIGFYYEHNSNNQSMQDAALPVDSIEALTGYDFYCNINKKIEKRVESKCKLRDWR